MNLSKFSTGKKMSNYDVAHLRQFSDMHTAWENCSNPETQVCMLQESMPSPKAIMQGFNRVIRDCLRTIPNKLVPKFFPLMQTTLTMNELYGSKDSMHNLANNLKRRKSELEESIANDIPHTVEQGIVSMYYWLACGLIAPTGRMRYTVLTTRNLSYLMRYLSNHDTSNTATDEQIKSNICDLIRSEFPNPFPK